MQVYTSLSEIAHFLFLDTRYIVMATSNLCISSRGWQAIPRLRVVSTLNSWKQKLILICLKLLLHLLHQNWILTTDSSPQSRNTIFTGEKKSVLTPNIHSYPGLHILCIYLNAFPTECTEVAVISFGFVKNIFSFKIGSHHVSLNGLELTMWIKLASNLWWSSYLGLPGAGITGSHHHVYACKKKNSTFTDSETSPMAFWKKWWVLLTKVWLS